MITASVPCDSTDRGDSRVKGEWQARTARVPTDVPGIARNYRPDGIRSQFGCGLTGAVQGNQDGLAFVMLVEDADKSCSPGILACRTRLSLRGWLVCRA